MATGVVGKTLSRMGTIRLAPFNFLPVSGHPAVPWRLNFGNPRAQCSMCMRIVALGVSMNRKIETSEGKTLSACPRSRHLVACLTKLQPSGTASPVGSCWGLRNWSKARVEVNDS
jgi:hypothetical protein